MQKRSFVHALAAAAVASPLVAWGQRRQSHARIGFLSSGSPAATAHLHEAFRQGLRELDWVPGAGVTLEYRYADGHFERLPALAVELVRAKPDILVASPTPSALAARDATRSIPIVFVGVGDPVGVGLVPDLARPGGNVTGLSFSVGLESLSKSLELFREAVPDIHRVGVLSNAGNPAQRIAMTRLATAADTLGIVLEPRPVRTAEELEPAFASIAKSGASTVLVVTDSLFILHRARVAELAIRHRLPSMHGARENVEAGGLVSYGPSLAGQFRRAATYVDKILKGANPGDLPIEQPATFELVINLATAKALGLAIPQSLLLRADEVIR